MTDRLKEELEELLDNHFSREVALEFRQRLLAGKLTRSENSEDHFCVYFAACDYKSKQLFIGHHIKSGLWLFNGGHIEKNEIPKETVAREINEEWGLDINDFNVGAPAFLTVTMIKSQTKRPCKIHFDIWYFINVDKNNFKPNQLNLAEEFYSVQWMNLVEAREKVVETNMLLALDFIETNYFGN
jgi:8-oxo-dGTP pyrophosphatase MutT (NUDIX family)